MNFQPAFKQQNVDGIYYNVLSADGLIPESGPWLAVVMVSKSEKQIPVSFPLSQVLKEAQQTNLYSHLVMVFFDAGVVAKDQDAFYQRLQTYQWPKVSPLLAWMSSTLTLELVSSLPLASKIDRKKDPQTWLELCDPANQQLLPISGGLSAAITVNSKADIKLDTNPADDALTLNCPSPISLGVAQGAVAEKDAIFIADSGMSIPVSGAACGCILGQGKYVDNGQGFGPKFRFDVKIADDSTQLTVKAGQVDYPVLDDANGLAAFHMSFSLNPNAPNDPKRTHFAFSATTASFKSAFRTRSGEVVLLTPTDDSMLSFNCDDDLGCYLSPAGGFAMSVASDAPDAALLCGLSGVEYISFVPGDRLAFAPNQPAGISFLPGQGVSQSEEHVFSPDEDSKATTPYLTLQTQDETRPEARCYYAEPDSAPFFANLADTSNPQQLDYLAVPRQQMPSQGKAKPFPMVPYAQLQKATKGPASDPATLRAFELQYLNPMRMQAIEESGNTTTASTNVRYALTPQGHKATFTDGVWTKLDVAQMSGPETAVDIHFEAQKGLPDALQRAFLTNQQFLVMSEATANLGDSFKPQIKMSNWTFDLDFSTNTMVGDYKNVLIFKNSDASFAQLAATPALWTGFSDFNSANDPDGSFLSNWLVRYLDDARDLYNQGKGVAALAPFIKIIDDPQWNGFLILNLLVNPTALDPEIEALISGIDTSLFSAHHVGNLSNHIREEGGEIALNSALFGLIHYTEPGYDNTQEDSIYVPNPNAYDFKVLTLEAVFEDAQLTHFSNNSQFIANTLFGDAVLSEDANKDKLRNSLIIHGTYKNVNGVATYTFATPPGTKGEFALSSNALQTVTMTKVTMGVVAEGKGYKARFGIWGQMAFQQQEGFDLLSFERLAFQNLTIDMHLTPNTDGDAQAFARSFTFSAANLVLERSGMTKLPSHAALPDDGDENVIREASLLASFPLKIKGFRSGSKTDLPTDRGYWSFSTTEPKGIKTADLSDTDWHGLSFDMILGSKGALASNAVLGAEVLLAWPTGGNGTVSIIPMIKLIGPEGMSLSFDIQGVVKFGAKDVVLNKIKNSDGKDIFLMIFESIGLSVLMLEFPPAGTTNVYLMGSPGHQKEGEVNPTLGWIGGYQAKGSE